MLGVSYGDDIFFKNTPGFQIYFEWLHDRYLTWSSRSLIELALSILVKRPLLFALTNAGATTLLIYSISRLFTRRAPKDIILVTLAFYALDYSIFATAGWGATLANYLWPLSLGLFALTPLRDIYESRGLSTKYCILCLIALLFSVSHEQFTCVAFGVILLMTIFYLYREKELHPYLVLSLIITIAGLVFALVSPGNSTRLGLEIETWYPAFVDFGILDKLLLGLNSLVVSQLLRPTLLIFTYLIIAAVVIFKKYENRFIRLVSLIPIVYVVIFTNINHLVDYAIPQVDKLNHLRYFLGPNPALPLSSKLLIVATLISVSWVAAIILTTFFVFKEPKTKKITAKDQLFKNLLYPTILCAGFASRIIIGFSPTIYASVTRTSVFLYVAFVITTVSLVVKKTANKNKGKLDTYHLAYNALAIPLILDVVHTAYVAYSIFAQLL